MAKRGKRYQAAAAKIDAEKVYSPSDAVRLVKETTTVSYDATVDIAVRLEKLESRLMRGTLTDDEFERQKRRLLGS